MATAAKWSTCGIDVTASTTGAATSAAKPASAKSRSADVTSHAAAARSLSLSYLLTGSVLSTTTSGQMILAKGRIAGGASPQKMPLLLGVQTPAEYIQERPQDFG